MKYAPPRSIRVPDEIWCPSRERSGAEGITISEVINRFLTGYAEGHLDAPQVQLVYNTQPTEENR